MIELLQHGGGQEEDGCDDPPILNLSPINDNLRQRIDYNINKSPQLGNLKSNSTIKYYYDDLNCEVNGEEGSGKEDSSETNIVQELKLLWIFLNESKSI